MEPVSGYAPNIGRLVCILAYAHPTLIAAAEGLCCAELDYPHDARGNSIAPAMFRSPPGHGSSWQAAYA